MGFLLVVDYLFGDKLATAHNLSIALTALGDDDLASRLGKTHTVASGVSGGDGLLAVAGFTGSLQVVSPLGPLQVWVAVIE